LLAHAEQALAQARGAGCNVYRVHRFSVVTDTRRRQRLERALREGLAAPEFYVHYQPRLDARTGQVQAVEALVRWHDRGHGDLLPAHFLPLTEQAGLAGVLDDWVMEQALRQALAWRQAGLTLAMNLNVSGWQLTQPGYARRVEAVLDHTGWPAGQLEIDVTEASLQVDLEASLAAIQALRQMGVRVLLDDFGTGESSLSLLRRFPLSGVKIDRSLMRGVASDLPSSTGDGALVSGLMGLARSLALTVLVEGVETEAQRRFVTEQGCEAWQGFLCAPALDAGRVRQLAREPAQHHAERATGT